MNDARDAREGERRDGGELSFAPELRHARPKPAHDGHVDLWQSRRAQVRDERAAPVTTELL
eukprot:5510716-Pleurochrysis_carterae.AAC.1